MFTGSGAIRNKRLGFAIRYADLIECPAYDDAIYMLAVTGSQLEKMLSHIIRDEAFRDNHTEFYQFSHGIRMVCSRKLHRFKKLSLEGKPLNSDGLYTVAFANFQYQSLPEFLNITVGENEKNAKIRVLATSYRNVAEEYMMKHQHLSREVRGDSWLSDGDPS